LPDWALPALAAVLTLAVGVLLVLTLAGGDDGEVVVVDTSPTDGGIENPLDDVGPADGGIEDPFEGEGEGDGGAGDGGGGGGEEPADDGGAGDGATAEQPGDDEATGDDADAEVPAVDTTMSENPLSIALMVSNADALTPQELSLTGMLEGNGHTVRPFTVTAEPIVNAVNNPRIDLLLFSPSFEFSLLYHPAQPDSLPMLDMARYSWYRRYMLPWSDDIRGQRFSGAGETTTNIFYEDADVIAWEGQEVGPVQLLTSARFAGEAPMREVLDFATDGAAQYFLRHVSDEGAESTLGVYVPAGSTITEPAPEPSGERRFTSVAPWMGLLLFIDDPGDGNQYAEMTPAGEGLFEAAMQHLVTG
jgi:hypothetical protein